MENVPKNCGIDEKKMSEILSTIVPKDGVNFAFIQILNEPLTQ
jgi:hypothetical protein